MNHIYVNLDGTYAVPDTHVAGSVSGDLRLEQLDAFLTSVKEAVAGHESQLLQLVKKLHRGNELKITCELDPSNNRLTYSFRLQALSDQ